MNAYDEFMSSETGVLVREMCLRSFLAGAAHGRNTEEFLAYQNHHGAFFEKWLEAEFRVPDPKD